MEAFPRLGPAGGNIPGRAGAEHLPQPLFAGRRRVRRQLELVVEAHLLEAFGEELEHHRARLLRTLERHAHGDSSEGRITHHPTP
jgi:hypothetical protein